MKNVVKSFTNQIDGVLLESSVKHNLLSLLALMLRDSSKKVDLALLERTLRMSKIYYVDDLNSDYYITPENDIFVDSKIFEKTLIERNYILNRALARALIIKNNDDRTLISLAMEETLADLATNYSALNNNLIQGVVTAKNRVNRDFIEMLLSLSTNRNSIITEYFFGSKRIFLGKLRATLAKNNLGLNCYSNLNDLIHNENVFDSKDFDFVFSQNSLSQLMDMCYSKDFLNLATTFTYNNIFLQRYIIDKYLENNRSLENFEMVTLNKPFKSELNITDDTELLMEYLKNRPEDFYRIRPYINEEKLSYYIKDILDELDQKFDAIVYNIAKGFAVAGINKYTYCYNPHASYFDRRLFLEKLVLSNGITNGFLLNELLEILKKIDVKKIKDKYEVEYIYNLIVEATKQFLNNNYFDKSKPYDAYTSKVLASSKKLLSKYNVEYPMTIPISDQDEKFVIKFLNDYENQKANEFKYLILKYHRNGFLKNPDTFVLPELMEIVNDPNVKVYRKYFEGILSNQMEQSEKRLRRRSKNNL